MLQCFVICKASNSICMLFAGYGGSNFLLSLPQTHPIHTVDSTFICTCRQVHVFRTPSNMKVLFRDRCEGNLTSVLERKRFFYRNFHALVTREVCCCQQRVNGILGRKTYKNSDHIWFCNQYWHLWDKLCR